MSGSLSLSLTQSQTLTALRTVLIGMLPAGIEIIEAEDNRVPEPEGPDFAIMTPLFRDRLSYNVVCYDPEAGTRTETMATEFTVQIDVHGPNSADSMQIIHTLFPSQYGVDAFAATGYPVAPLSTSRPHQAPFSNSEQQIEMRWTIDLVLEVKPAITLPQDFADSLSVTTTPVETT